MEKIDNDDLHNLHSPPNIKVITSSKLGWSKCVVGMGELKSAC